MEPHSVAVAIAMLGQVALDLALVVSIAVSVAGIVRALRNGKAYSPSAVSSRLVTALVVVSPVVVGLQCAAYSLAMDHRLGSGNNTTLANRFLAHVLQSAYLPIDQDLVDRLLGANSNGVAIALTAVLLLGALAVVVAFAARARWSWYFVRGFALFILVAAPLRILLLGRTMVLSSASPAPFGAVHGISLGLVVIRLLFAAAVVFTLGSPAVRKAYGVGER